MADPLFDDLKAGTIVIFNLKRQAFFPGDPASLSKEFPTAAKLKFDVRYEPAIGIRAHDFDLEIIKTWKPLPKGP